MFTRLLVVGPGVYPGVHFASPQLRYREYRRAGSRAAGIVRDVSVNPRVKRFLQRRHRLRTRQDVINHVWNVPGVYIYAATAEKSGGHAFNFDTRNTKTRSFFDPNQGEWVFEDESLVSVRNWWKEFWEAQGAGQINYKTAFHKGVRELIKFDVPPTA